MTGPTSKQEAEMNSPLPAQGPSVPGAATAGSGVTVPRDQLETLRRSIQLGNLLPGEGENLISLWIMASDAEAKS